MTFVIAHRGSAQLARENTLEAFAASARQGAPWVELDVRASSDGVPVVLHDPVGDIAAADLPDWLPTLASALDACAGLGVGVVVEVKEVAIAPATARLLAGLHQEIVVSSFHPVALDVIKSAGSSLALLVAPGMDAVAAVDVAKGRGCRALHPHLSAVDETLVASCRVAGLDVVPWTVNDPDELRRMVTLGVTAVITDDVTMALSLT